MKWLRLKRREDDWRLLRRSTKHNGGPLLERWRCSQCGWWWVRVAVPRDAVDWWLGPVMEDGHVGGYRPRSRADLLIEYADCAGNLRKNGHYDGLLERW